MQETEVIRALAALAQETRLRLFRLLIEAAPEGLTPGHMAERLDASATVLSFHLKELNHAGLVSSQRGGRHIVYKAHIDCMNQLLGYLTTNCCQGQPCLDSTPSNCTECR